MWKVAVGLGLVMIVIGAFAIRANYGRSRPDIAAWVSFDDGLFAFAKTFQDGDVGPFRIGTSRAETASQLSRMALLEQDLPQLSQASQTWRISLQSPSGGYTTYTLTFANDHIASVKAYHAVLAGL